LLAPLGFLFFLNDGVDPGKPRKLIRLTVVRRFKPATYVKWKTKRHCSLEEELQRGRIAWCSACPQPPLYIYIIPSLDQIVKA